MRIVAGPDPKLIMTLRCRHVAVELAARYDTEHCRFELPERF